MRKRNRKQDRARATARAEYERVAAAAAAELAGRRLCGALSDGADGVCHLDAGHYPRTRHMARVGDRIIVAGGGVRRNVIAWGLR